MSLEVSVSKALLIVGNLMETISLVSPCPVMDLEMILGHLFHNTKYWLPVAV